MAKLLLLYEIFVCDPVGLVKTPPQLVHPSDVSISVENTVHVGKNSVYRKLHGYPVVFILRQYLYI